MVKERFRSCTRLIAILHIVVSLMVTLAAHAEGPPCLARVEVTPAHAFVGQQVAYVVRILRRPDVGSVSWIQGLNFPSFRAEWIPGQTGHARLFEQGTPYLVYEERRALFPMRAGRLDVPPAGLSCALYAPAGSTGRELRVDVPASAVEVDEPPASGRPPSWSGLVGPVDLRLAGEPSAIALGDTVRITLTLTGDGNLWVAPAPFGETSFEGRGGLHAEVFARPPELASDPGERLHLRRVFAYELVPKRSGRLVIPSYEVSFFDPARGRFGVSSSGPLEIAVGSAAIERESRAGDHTLGHAEAGPSAAALLEREQGGAQLLGLGLALAAAFGAAILMKRRFGPRVPENPIRAALRDADRARRAGDAAAEQRALRRALRAGLERAVCAKSDALSVDELTEQARGDQALTAAAEILRADERARFSEDGVPPDALRLRAAAHALARRS